MTDKVQKIREEVERVKTIHSSVSLKNSKPDRLAVQVCINLLSFIDSLQEEPVSKNMETDIAIRLGGVCHKQVWHENQFSKEDCKAYCSLYKECQECSLDFCMIFFHDPHCHFEEEPVREDLEEESDKYAAAVCQLMVINGNDDDDSIEEYLKRAFKAGAEWQKRKDFQDMLMSDNRNFEKCYKKGKEDIKQQMMKDLPVWKKGGIAGGHWSGEAYISQGRKTQLVYETMHIDVNELVKKLPKEDGV